MERAQQQQAMKDLAALVDLFANREDDIRALLLRDRFSTGQRLHKRGELGEMTGTPTPHTQDPTGETATWDEVPDAAGKMISAMARSMRQWMRIVDWFLSLDGTDVVVRAQRTVPDCLACGQPVEGKVISGYDRSCYDRWVYLERPDRHAFAMRRKAELADKSESPKRSLKSAIASQTEP